MNGASKISDSVDHQFRHNAGQMSAVLTRIFGFGKIDLIEDSIQEAMIRALDNWSIKGVPDNPTAWLTQVAKNRILDRLRKENRYVGLENDARELEEYSRKVEEEGSGHFEKEIREDQLQMIFACCHPSLTPDSRIALTLKTVGGFSVKEIAAAFLSKDEAVAKMLTRAKKRLADDGVRIGIPGPDKIPDRLETVLKVLYLMFNEGYAASAGEEAVRTDLCYEAIRLARLLCAHPVTSLPKVNALAALFMFQASRLPARGRAGARLIILGEQDRSLWDRALIAEGLRHLQRSAAGDELSEYHLEAEIASHHVLSESYETTNWPAVLSAYDELICRRPSPVASLNRIIALAEVEGAESALEELRDLGDEKLEAYYPFHVTLAELYRRTGRDPEAIRSYEFAAGLINNEVVREYVLSRAEELAAEI